jgi:hypothetical protein
MTDSYNPQNVELFLNSLGHISAGGCTEIRILPKEQYIRINGHREYVGKTVSGYYTDYAKASQDVTLFDGKENIYATLNPCDKKLMRRAHNKLEFNVKDTASDKDIISICWFPLDMDPVRPANTSASEAELAAALIRRDQIIKEVFEPHRIPVIRAMSGNGGHGLIRLPGYLNDDETQTKIKQLLDWLKETYSDDTVSVDSSIANPARIWKVYGTLACKGDNTPDAPYRRAFVDLPNAPFEPFDLLDIINQIVPANSGSGDAPAKNNQSRPRPMKNGTGTYPVLDVEKYLSHYGCSFRTKQKGDRTLYILNECPFNPNHNQGEVCVTQETDGKLGFKCHHDSCGDKGWQDAKAVIGDPKPFFQGTQKQSCNTGKDEPEAHQEYGFQGILEEIGQATVIMNDNDKSQAVIRIVDKLVYLEPTEQNTLIDKMKAVGLGSKSSLEAQLKKSKQRRTSERNEERREQAQNDNDLPVIETVFRHLREVTQDTLDAILLQNKKAPRIFVRGGVLNRIKPYESKSLICEVLNASACRGEIERAANFVGGQDYGGNPVSMPVNPPTDVVADLMALPEWKGIPILKGIIHAPVLNTDGMFDTAPGYQKKSQNYYAPDKKLKIGDTEPTDENVSEAKLLIFDDLLGEFCFADNDSRANALALMLMPFVRPIIDGQTPLHLIDAPTEGSGKGLLADVLTYPFKPDGGTLMTEGESDEEWRKRITAVLSEAPSHVMIDNISKKMEAGSFAAVLTAKFWSDRLLGTNTTAKFPVTQTWLATGNNVEMSREITRRTVWVRLRPSVEDPSQKDFRIKNLRQWALDHRSELITACLTLIRKWVALKMPEGNVRKGSYESWASIMSGILDAVGVEGFLGNYAKLGEKANEANEIWREFVRAWNMKHGQHPVGVSDLFLLASTKTAAIDGQRKEIGQNLLGDLLPQETERGRRNELGKLLKSQIDRVYGIYRILRAEAKKNAAQYQLENVGESGESTQATLTETLTHDKHSVSQASSTLGECGECSLRRERGRGGAIDTPPDEVSRVETDSPHSPPSPEPVPPPAVNVSRVGGESPRSASSDSPTDREVIRI